MQRTKILTAHTLEALDAQIQEWTPGEWFLHGDVFITAWDDKKALLPDGTPGLQSEATGFAQMMAKIE